MQNWETVNTEHAAGFEIRLSVTPELDAPDWDFQSVDEEKEVLRKIDNGTLVWFVARVEAIKNGIVLGTDYLGGCCYDSVQQFIDSNDYYADMVEAAVNEARNNLALLCGSTA